MRAMGFTAVACAAALGCGSAGYAPGAAPPPCSLAMATAVTSDIALAGMEFVPSCAKVTNGVNITFTNDDPYAHTVTTDASQPETFDASLPTAGSTFTHAFATAGTTVHVHCNLHANMHLTVFVQ